MLYSKVIFAKDIFFIKHDVIIKIREIQSGIPEESVLDLLCTADLSADTNVSIATFADDTCNTRTLA